MDRTERSWKTSQSGLRCLKGFYFQALFLCAFVFSIPVSSADLLFTSGNAFLPSKMLCLLCHKIIQKHLYTAATFRPCDIVPATSFQEWNSVILTGKAHPLNSSQSTSVQSFNPLGIPKWGKCLGEPVFGVEMTVLSNVWIPIIRALLFIFRSVQLGRPFSMCSSASSDPCELTVFPLGPNVS